MIWPKRQTQRARKSDHEFQDGYRAGVDTLSEDAIKMINEEGHLQEEVGDDLGAGMAEWVRGFWAARCQMAAAGINKETMIDIKALFGGLAAPC
jgi:hypothetical protein